MLDSVELTDGTVWATDSCRPAETFGGLREGMHGQLDPGEYLSRVAERFPVS